MSSESTTNNPPSNPFSGGDKEDEGVRFDAFSLSPSNANISSPMPSLQSIQQQEQQQQSQPPQQKPQELKFDSLPSPMEMSGPMNDTTSKSTSNISYTTQPLTTPNVNINNTPNNNQNNQSSFLSKLLSCGGLCSIQVLQPYFDIDTADIFVRIKGSIQYVLVMDGFRNEVLYSDNAFRLAYRDTSNSGSVEGDDDEGADGSDDKATATTLPVLQPQQTAISSGKGPDLYGPIWLTMTLVFFVAVTSNISLYIHHTKKNKSIVIDEGGEAAEEEWDYDINQLLHATWIFYSFTLGIPTLLYFLLRLVGSGNGSSSLGLVELICLYGYSLVPYLPVAWFCIIPYSWVQWLLLSVSTVLSGMLVLRNVAGSIISSSGGGGMVGGLQGKGGGMIMCVVGFHFVFFLVMKIAFYHHH